MKQLFKKGRARGFTIVELIIVIVIIGILAAVSIIAYNGVTNNARDKAVLSDIDAVQAEITRYSVKNGGVYGSAVAWYSGGSANANINFIPSPGDVIDVVASTNDYCIRGYNTAGTKNSITNASYKESTPGACVGLQPSVAAGGSGQNNLIGWWKFNGSAIDSSGNSYNGVVNGAMPIAGQDGTMNNAYSFSGADNITLTTFPTTTNPLTITAWVKPVSLSQLGFNGNVAGGTIIESNENSGPNGYILGIRSNNKTWWWPIASKDTFGNADISLNVWTFIVLTFDGTNAKIYKNGVLDTTNGASSQVPQTPTFIRIGSKAWTTGYWNGSLDDIRIYSRALSANEIISLYSNGAQ